MVKIFIGFWQCILAQILLVCLIDLPFLLFGLTGFGILKIAHLVGELPYNKKKGFDPYEMAAIIGIDIVYGNEQKYQNDGKITIDKNTNIKTNPEHKHEVFIQFLKAVDYRKNKLGEI